MMFQSSRVALTVVGPTRGVGCGVWGVRSRKSVWGVGYEESDVGRVEWGVGVKEWGVGVKKSC